MRFSIHGFCDIVVDSSYRFKKSLIRILENFQSPLIEEKLFQKPLLIITDGPQHVLDVRVEDSVPVFTLQTRRDVTYLLMPMIDIMLIFSDSTLVHAAAVKIGNRTVLLAAKGGTGKTITAIQLVKEFGAKYIGDDFVIVDKSGKVYSFPKPMVFYSYHKTYLNQIKGNNISSINKLLLPQSWLPLLDTVRRIVKRATIKSPKLRALANKIRPDCIYVNPNLIFTKNEMLETAYLDEIIIIERIKGNLVESIELVGNDVVNFMLVNVLNEYAENSIKEILEMLLNKYNVVSFSDFLHNKLEILQNISNSTKIAGIRFSPKVRKKFYEVILYNKYGSKN